MGQAQVGFHWHFTNVDKILKKLMSSRGNVWLGKCLSLFYENEVVFSCRNVPNFIFKPGTMKKKFGFIENCSQLSSNTLVVNQTKYEMKT